jgi:deazaflavin-dependent oxidoreductase (nitroreductase family)
VFWPTGLIVLEHTGRRTGRTYRAPVTASVIGPHIVASTVRGRRSQWLKNLAVAPLTTYWLGGRRRTADATVFAPGAPAPDVRGLPALLLPLVPGLSVLASLGMGFVILTTRPPGGAPETRDEARTDH